MALFEIGDETHTSDIGWADSPRWGPRPSPRNTIPKRDVGGAAFNAPAARTFPLGDFKAPGPLGIQGPEPTRLC